MRSPASDYGAVAMGNIGNTQTKFQTKATAPERAGVLGMSKTLQAATNDVFHGHTTLERAIADLAASGTSLSMNWCAETDAWDVGWITDGRRYLSQNTSLRMALCGVMAKKFTHLMSALVAQGALEQ